MTIAERLSKNPRTPNRVNFNAEIIGTLRHRVIDHNARHPEARQTRLEELKRIYKANHKGADAHGRALRAVDNHLAELLRRQAMVLPSLAECERLADFHLGRQEHGLALHRTLEIVCRMATEGANHVEGTRRRDLVLGALKHADGLAASLQKLDRRSIASLMGPTSIPMPVPPMDPLPEELADDPYWTAIRHALTQEADTAAPECATRTHLSVLPLRLAELEGFIAQLESVARALASLAEATSIPMGRPKLEDPLRFGVEALASLWTRARGERPRQSFNRGSFGDLVMTVFGESGPRYPVTEIQTAVRQVLETAAPTVEAGTLTETRAPQASLG